MWKAAASSPPPQPISAVADSVQTLFTSTNGSPVEFASSTHTSPAECVTAPFKTRCGPLRTTHVPPDCFVVAPVTVSDPVPVMVLLSTVRVVPTAMLPLTPEYVIWPPLSASDSTERASETVTLSPPSIVTASVEPGTTLQLQLPESFQSPPRTLEKLQTAVPADAGAIESAP